MTLDVGTQCRLKSGSPPLTVERHNDNGTVACTWFNSGKIERFDFAETSLVPPDLTPQPPSTINREVEHWRVIFKNGQMLVSAHSGGRDGYESLWTTILFQDRNTDVSTTLELLWIAIRHALHAKPYAEAVFI